jgi:hypothetical protein
MTPTLDRRVVFLLLLTLFLLLEADFLVVYFLAEVRLDRVVLVLLALEDLLALVVFLLVFYSVSTSSASVLILGVVFLVVFFLMAFLTEVLLTLLLLDLDLDLALVVFLADLTLLVVVDFLVLLEVAVDFLGILNCF